MRFWSISTQSVTKASCPTAWRNSSMLLKVQWLDMDATFYAVWMGVSWSRKARLSTLPLALRGKGVVERVMDSGTL